MNEVSSPNTQESDDDDVYIVRKEEKKHGRKGRVRGEQDLYI